jgi:hypothetical protein
MQIKYYCTPSGSYVIALVMLYEWGQGNKPTGEKLLSRENKVAFNCQWQKIMKNKIM